LKKREEESERERERERERGRDVKDERGCTVRNRPSLQWRISIFRILMQNLIAYVYVALVVFVSIQLNIGLLFLCVK